MSDLGFLGGEKCPIWGVLKGKNGTKPSNFGVLRWKNGQNGGFWGEQWGKGEKCGFWGAKMREKRTNLGPMG